MIKRFLTLLIISLTCISVQAQVNKVAIVDVQKVVNKSAQVQALKKEQDSKRKEIAQLVKKAGEELSKEKDQAKKKAIAQKYEKQIKTKQETYSKTYKTKLETIVTAKTMYSLISFFVAKSPRIVDTGVNTA